MGRKAAGVAIVGAGPAGAACALVLARAGVEVTLVERQPFPRRKVCGEYLNGGAVAHLADLGLLGAVSAAAGPLLGIRLVPPGAPALELPFPAPALACPRAVLDDLILQAARAAGATLVRGHAEEVVFEAERAAGVVVRDEAGERRTLPARFVVGADGAGSLVARKLGLARAAAGARRFALGGHYQGFGEFDGHVEMYVGAGAYFALNPLPGELCNVMLVVRDRDLAGWAGAVDEGMRGKAAALGRGHRSFAAVQRVGPRVSVGPLAFAVSAVASPGALLVGDAGGFLNPFTGQGVFLALASARQAAAAILGALQDRSRESSAWANYAELRSHDFAVRRRLTRLVDLLLDVPLLARRAVSRLGGRPELGATLLGALGGTTPPERGLSPGLVARLVL